MSLPTEETATSLTDQNDFLEQSIPSRFQQLVKKYPNHLAIKTKQEQITYDRLNKDANLLARAVLHQQGQATEVIALLLDTGAAFIAGMFAMLKIGKTYVPLDPTFPLARLIYIIQDSQAVMIVTNTQNLSLANDLAQGRLNVFNIDNIDQNTSRDNLDLDIPPETPAYILYTSGSTGNPKGVFQSQHNLFHNIRNQIHTYQISPTDRMTLLYSCSVMGALRGILNALLSGAALYPLNIQKHGLEELEKLLVREEITIMHTIPTIFRSFVSCLAEVEQFPHLRLLILGGEMVLRREFILYQKYCSANTLLFTGIGSTEAGTICCLSSDKQTQFDSSVVPAGYPIDDVEVLIVDENRTEVARGEVGEIVVKSQYLALGYWQKEELTREKFVTHSNGDRFYFTGDLGRIDANGCLWTLGRKDLQVKIRGYRIEISEIEMALFDSGMVKASAIIVDDDATGAKQLIAYIVLADGCCPSIRELRQNLLKKLPTYMVPSFFVFLESLPITPNGKINRLALPSLQQVAASTYDDFVEPRNATEEILVTIWTKLFQIPKVSIHDNFFDLGGHSLLAIQLISRCRQVFSVEVTFWHLFANSTIAELALIITELKLQDPDLLASQTITPRNESTNIKLSFAQQRLWILDQLEPNSSLYNIQDAFQLIGELQVEVLQQALDAIAIRHEIIRTSYIAENGNPVQVINAPKSIELTIIDLQNYAEIEQKTQAQKILQQESQRPFNLALDTMLRGCLLQLAPQKHILLLVIHHIAADAWSMGILWEELTQLYQAFVTGQDNPLPELPIQYADFTVWQREWLSGKVLDQQLQYWKQQLANVNPVLELPTDFSRPVVQSYRAKIHSVPLPEKLSFSLREFCRREGVTLYMLLLTAFQTLLYRYTGQEDILVGSPIAGRNRAEVERLIGFFVNTVVLRTDLSGDPSFRQLLAKVRSTTLEAYSYQDLHFDKLVEELQPERSLAYNPIFQVMFSVEKSPTWQREFAGLTANSLPIESKTVKFDLDVTVIEEGASELIAVWNYKTDLFKPSTIERIAGHFQTLLEGIVANPEQVVSQLPLLTKSEQEQLLSSWNHHPTEYTQEWVQHLFEQQTERTPEAVAVLFESQRLTYRELNSKSNQLAHYLRSLGVAADQFVGISLERSLDMIVAILGVLKAGAAYIPLDPAYPRDRLSYMIADANISVLLTQNKWRTQLPFHQAEVVYLDSDWEKIAVCSRENPIRTNTGENLAYVIYTSGSTGKPKGVMISHQALTRFTQTIISEYQITSDDRLLQFASINFDVAVEEIYPSLCTGATLVLRNDEMLSDLRTFFQACNDLQLTVINLPTAYWHDLVAELNVSELPLPESLRLVLIGGEKVLPEPVRSWQKYIVKSGKSDRLQLINAYGPTETTVSATLYRVPNTIDINGEVPIGRPLAHLQTYILDTHLQPVPIGVSGELYIGGDSLARGYLNRPELTNEQFIPNAFSIEVGSRLYKTGDLARYLSDGNIEYLGRIDNQVKIRGFRIELGEIETVLSQHPNIRATVVTAREDSPSNKRLVAYIVADQVQPQVTDLRNFLQEHLPNYMIPSAFVFLESMPITPNGKIDYRSLPAPDPSSLQLDTEFVAPSNAMEESLVNIWADVLGVKRIGIHDNFFDLGGHSLLAIQVISRCRQVFSIEIPLKVLFEQPTIAQLGDRIKTLLWLTEVQQTNTDIQPTSRSQSLPLSFAQQRLWFLDQLEPNSSFYNIPSAIHLQGELKVDILQKALDGLVAHHEILRTNYIISENGNPIQSIAVPSPVELKIFDLRQYESVEKKIQIQKVLQQESQYPFNLASALMIRGCLLKLSNSEQILLIVQHHIASDGWSIGIMWEQLTQLYLAFLEGKPNPLSPLPIQYADYAVWQRQWLSGEVLAKQLNYWKQQLANANPLLELPIDHPRPSLQTYRGARQTHILPSSLSAAINQLCRQEGVTLYMTLLAAFQVLMHRYSRQDDIVVGSAIAGRNQIEIEELIGFFVNTLVLRNDLSGNPSFKELLSKVRTTTLDAYAHQDLPFEKLVEELNPERSLSYSPLFQVMFVLQNTPSQTEQLLGLETEFVRIDASTAKFDLDLSMEEKGDVLVASWTYNIDLFEADTIERMREHFQILLEGIVSNPNQSIDQLPMLTDKERHKLLIEWNNTCTDYPQDKCIHQLFEKQVELTPDAIAISFQDQQLTYRELNNRANQLAHYLQKLGVKPDVLVGICVERSLEMIVDLLGILKAGGAYVPLDPSYPQERIEYMLEDAQIKVLLTQKQLVEKLPTKKLVVICGDEDYSKISKESQETPICSANSDNIAYINYTSGSTGKPKGVVTPHRGVTRLLFGVNYINFNAKNKFIQMAPISFDASTLEIWGALLFGAQCVLSPVRVPTAKDLREVIQKHSITTMWLTSALFNSIIDTDPRALEGVCHLLTGGEALSVNHIERAIKALPSTQIINGYGPTESTTFACCYQIPRQLGNSIQSIPIGKPIGNTQIYLLDSYLQPVPIGVSGEICIGGDGLARGYLNREELTEEKFIPNPFGAGRIYKTGDFARYKHDGNIEFLGRVDSQVKIRGFRIEIGEIESILSQHPKVQATVVTAREDSLGDKKLIAYVVIEQEQAQFIDFKTFLQERLPNYMIPSAFVFLDAIPITSNGKIDYRSLPAPDISSIQLDQDFVPPRNYTEEILAKIWADVLGIERVGINENFFDLGGHSLLSIRLVSEIEKAFNCQIPLSSLFKISSIAEIAELIDDKPSETIDEQDLCLGLSIDDYRALLSHSAGKAGLRLGKRGLIINILPDTQTTSQPFIWIGEGRTGKKLNLKRPLYVMPGASLSDSMNSYNDYISVIASLLVDELLSVSSCESYSLGGWCYNGLVALEMAQRLQKLGKKVDLVTLIDSDSIGVSRIYRFAHKINFYLGTIRFHLFKLSKLSLRDKWEYIISRIQRSKSTFNDYELDNKPNDRKFEFDQEARNVLSKAVLDYIPKEYGGKVLLVIGTEQIIYGEKDIKYFELSWFFPYCGWGNILRGEVHVSQIKCDHLELMEDPYCEQVGVAIQKAESLL